MPPILLPSSAKHIATQILVIAKIKWKKREAFLREYLCDFIRPYKELPVQSSLLKHKNKVWKLFQIKNENTRTMLMASF